ncbi:helix-turn-helix transcriptional regulator [bacterium]|nr:helix-turn-helix transcriptional regulator [bacterium]
MIKLKDLPKNPVETTIKMIGCRWKVLIIRELLDGTKRFNELKKSIKGITQKVLSAKLKELEEDELLEREVISINPPKVEYTLTEVGYSLRSVIEAMKDWGKDYKKYTKLTERFGKLI